MAIKTITTDFRVQKNIDINKSTELLYWSEKYNVPVEKILETVTSVGPLVKNVEAKLRRKS
jgi:hypothetical protein